MARCIRPSIVVAALVLCPIRGFAEVDPDCHAGAEAFVCAPERLEEATLADRIAQPVFAKTGWVHGCYRVLITKGDDGGSGTLLVVLDGAKGAQESLCQVPPVEGLTEDEVRDIHKRGGGLPESVSATAEKSAKKGAANAATPHQIKEIGRALKAAILEAPAPTRSRLLSTVKRLSVGNGYGGDVDLPLP